MRELSPPAEVAQVPSPRQGRRCGRGDMERQGKGSRGPHSLTVPTDLRQDCARTDLAHDVPEAYESPGLCSGERGRQEGYGKELLLRAGTVLSSP